MKQGFEAEICSGTYFPRRGRPQRGYYVVLNEIVVSGPFRTRRGALQSREQIVQLNNTVTTGTIRSKYLHPAYARVIASVLRKQEKTLTAAIGSVS